MCLFKKSKLQLINDKIKYLRKLGAVIGEHVFIENSVMVDEALAKHLYISDGAVIAHRCSLILHDSAMNNIMGLPVRVGDINIGKNAYIGHGTIILPGVTIGDNALIGAGSIVTKDIQANMVAYGSPARAVCTIEEYKDKYIEKMQKSTKYEYIDMKPWREKYKT